MSSAHLASIPMGGFRDRASECLLASGMHAVPESCHTVFAAVEASLADIGTRSTAGVVVHGSTGSGKSALLNAIGQAAMESQIGGRTVRVVHVDACKVAFNSAVVRSLARCLCGRVRRTDCGQAGCEHRHAFIVVSFGVSSACVPGHCGRLGGPGYCTAVVRVV